MNQFSSQTVIKNPSDMSTLRASKILKSYAKRPVLRDVSIEVQTGEVIALLGPNGAGKTTAFYILAGLIKPDSGFVYMDDMDMTPMPIYDRARFGMGYLPQESSIFRGMNVLDNILSITERFEPSKKQAIERAEYLMEEFSISHLRETNAVMLSGGERRRLEIARSLATYPKFLLLDEPFAGVDPISVGDIRALVSDLKQRGIGILVTDHNVRETLDIIDRGYILYDGHILMHGTKEEIIEHPDVRKYYLGEDFYYK